MLRVIGLPGKLLAINLRLWCLIPCLFFLTGALKGREGGELTLSVKTSSDCVESLLSCGTGTSAKDRSGQVKCSGRYIRLLEGMGMDLAQEVI